MKKQFCGSTCMKNTKTIQIHCQCPEKLLSSSFKTITISSRELQNNSNKLMRMNTNSKMNTIRNIKEKEKILITILMGLIRMKSKQKRVNKMKMQILHQRLSIIKMILTMRMMMIQEKTSKIVMRLKLLKMMLWNSR